MQAQSAHSFATAQDMPDNYDVAGRQVAHRMLPKHAIEKTTNFHFDEIKTHKISTKTKDGYIQWAAIKDILDVMDLLTICNGIRTKPVTGNDNHHGYTEGYQGIHNERTFYVGPDDIYRYHNDFRRVFPTMHAAFDPSFHHVSQEGFNNKDGIRVFQDMDTHFEGRTTNDAMRHWNNLIHFTPRTSATIKEDCVRLDELFFHYEKVLQEKLPNILKMSIFVSHFQFDPRPLVQHRIATLEFTESTYMQMFHSVSSLNPVTSHVVHQVKALVVGKQYCRNFAAGKCQYKENCKYVHELPPGASSTKPAAPPPKHPTSPAKTSLPSKTTYPKYIDASHRQSIGPPRGIVSQTNPHGISKKQLYALQVISKSTAASSDHNWYGPNSSVGSQLTDKPRVYMMRTRQERKSESSSSLARRSADDDPSDDEPEQDTSHSRRSVYGALRFAFGPLSSNVRTGIMQYNKDLNTLVSDPMTYVIYSYQHPQLNSPEPHLGLAIFGWTTKGPSRHVSTARPDIRDGAPRLMNIIYLIGRDILRATMILPIFAGYWEADSFNTFSPNIRLYIPPGVEGSYVSTIQEIGQYFQAIAYVETMDLDEHANTLVMLAILFDFAAFCAQTFRRLIGNRLSSAAGLQGPRDIFIESIQTRDAELNDSEYRVILNAMRAIVKEVEPIPYRASASVEAARSIVPPDSHRKRRRDDTPPSAVRMSYDILPNELPRYTTVLQAVDTGPTPPRPRVPDALAVLQTPPPTTPRTRDVTQETPVYMPTSPVLTPLSQRSPLEGMLSPELQSPPPVAPPTPQVADTPPPETHHANLVIHGTETMLALAHNSSTVFDSGCSISGTSDIHALTDVTNCGPLSVQGAFGPSTQPKKRGLLGPLGLDAILIPGMGNQTLISLSQFCAGGTSGHQYVGIFTATNFRMFRLDSILPSLEYATEHGDEAVRGTVHNGIYVQEST